MAIRQILKINNPEELLILRKKSKPVEVFDERLNTLITDMIDTMKRADGAGLSAVQVGVLKRVFVVSTEEGVQEFINPEIIETSGECPILEEGCLSVPGRYGKVIRPNKVVIKAQDKTGKEFIKTYTGFEAKAMAHENDHLDGVLYIDLEIKREKKKGKK